MLQRTIKKSITCSGIGLHSGRKVGLTLRPADPGSGILFVVKGDFGVRHCRLDPFAVSDTGLATTLGQGECRVATVEHLMAAVRGLGVDNLIIETVGGEIPIMDGSAASFVLLLHSAGLRQQDRPRTVCAITKPVRYERDGKWISAEPYDGFRLDYTICFDHPRVGTQTMRLDVNERSFVRRLARARTFGFLRDVEMLQKSGLAKGGSLSNAVVLDEYGVVNPEGLRFDDEFVRHKMLDFIGDMALYAHPLQGAFSVHCSGHALNNAFLRYLAGNSEEFLELRVLHGAGASASREEYVRGGRKAVAWAS